MLQAEGTVQSAGAGLLFLLYPRGTLHVPTYIGRSNSNASGVSGREERIGVTPFLLWPWPCIAACSLMLQIYSCLFVFPGDCCVRGFPVLLSKIVLHLSCCSVQEAGKPWEGNKCVTETRKASQDCPGKESGVRYHKQFAGWFSLKLCPMAALFGVSQCIFSGNYCLKYQFTFLFSFEHCQDGQNCPRLSLVHHWDDGFSFNEITCGSVPSDCAVAWSCVAWRGVWLFPVAAASDQQETIRLLCCKSSLRGELGCGTVLSQFTCIRNNCFPQLGLFLKCALSNPSFSLNRSPRNPPPSSFSPLKWQNTC